MSADADGRAVDGPEDATAPRPLTGRRILVTRAEEQAEAMTGPLAARGAVPLVCPTIEIVPVADMRPFDEALRALATYDWVLFTSANTVRFLSDRMAALGLDASAFAEVGVLAIGPATAEALHGLGIAVDVVPREYVAESVFDAFGIDGAHDKRFLLPRAAEARDVLPAAIRESGGTIDVVPVYVTRLPEGGRARLDAILAEGPLDAALFTSASTVRHFTRLAGGEMATRALLAGAVVACIGPIAAKTARDAGLRVDVMPREATVPSLVEALEAWFAERAPR